MRIRVGNADRLIAELEAILSLSADRIKAVENSLAPKSGRDLLSREDLSAHLEQTIGDDSREVAEYFESFLIQFAGAIREDRISASAMKDVIANELKKRGESDLLSKFSSVWPSLQATICSNAVRLVEKTTRLAFDHSDILTDVRILTDIRPVYDDDRENIESAIIVQTMRIDYSRNGRRASITLALNNADLDNLKSCVDSAVSKSISAQKLVESKLKVSAHIPGLADEGK